MDLTSLAGKNWAALRREAQRFLSAEPPDGFDLAVACYKHPAWEVRFFAVSVLGGVAGKKPGALDFLFENCGDDESWQVNEALAMAFDDYCAAIGYEQALPVMQQWLQAPSPNLRRAVSEGLRPWIANKRGYFARNPRLAVQLLLTLQDDESRYVQESVGNALRDIWRRHPELVLEAVTALLDERPTSTPRRVIARYALQQAVKADPSLRRLF
jgi:3-methyladenine DNA glycosylase AlkC